MRKSPEPGAAPPPSKEAVITYIESISDAGEATYQVKLVDQPLTVSTAAPPADPLNLLTKPKPLMEHQSEIVSIEDEEEPQMEKKPRISPVFINSFTSAQSVLSDPNKYGGKAASLAKLVIEQLPVPQAWVFPCSASIERPLLTFPSGWRTPLTRRFSVRSGAPISMPGLLQTKLDVPYSGLRKAIKEVWNSWNAPAAVEYRNNKGIPHAMGTAVIVQEFYPNIVYSGVSFTVDPANNDGPGSAFDPVIEFTAKADGSLVGGTDSGQVASPKNMNPYTYKRLRQILAKLHASYGPSDIEFCVTPGPTWSTPHLQNIWFLQWRPLKLSPKPVQLPSASDVGGREIVVQGRPIGAPVTVVTENALVVEHFEPELYPKMMAAPAILTKTGGATCHAGIIARELGKPAISGVDLSEIVKGDRLWINGQLGVVAKALSTDEVTDTKVEIKQYVPRYPSLEIRRKTWGADALASRFYMAVEGRRVGSLSQERYDVIVDDLAHILVSYQYIITMTELRYIHCQRDKAMLKYEQIMDDLRKEGMVFPPYGKECSRGTFSSYIIEPKDLDHATRLMTLVYAGFMELPWATSPTSVGGKAWGSIAKLALDYLRGASSPTLYVDACFNIQHNSGRSFGKFTWFQEGLLQDILDAKLAGPDQLKRRISGLGIEVDLNKEVQIVLPKKSGKKAVAAEPPQDPDYEEDPEDEDDNVEEEAETEEA